MKMDCRSLRRTAFCAKMEQNHFSARGMESIKGVCSRSKTWKMNIFFLEWGGRALGEHGG